VYCVSEVTMGAAASCW